MLNRVATPPAVRFGKINLKGFDSPKTFPDTDDGREAKKLLDAALSDARVGPIKDLISDNVLLSIRRIGDHHYNLDLSTKQWVYTKLNTRAGGFSTVGGSSNVSNSTVGLDCLKKGATQIIDWFLAEALQLTVAEKLGPIVQAQRKVGDLLKSIPRTYRPHAKVDLQIDIEESPKAKSEWYKALHPEVTIATNPALTLKDTAILGTTPEEAYKWLKVDGESAAIGKLNKAEGRRIKTFKAAVATSPVQLVKELDEMLKYPGDFRTSSMEHSFRQRVVKWDGYKIYEGVLVKKLGRPEISPLVALSVERAIAASGRYTPSDKVKKALAAYK